jgi:N-acyl-D-aspartate/D-glutamate deacylase
MADGEYDVVIKNARIYDGSLDEPFKGDIGIKDGKIVEVGKIREPEADTIIEAKGLAAAPGFIDLHTHVDRGMTYKELAACLNYLKQGVTTVVVGQCGRSAWPVFEKIEDQVDRWQKSGIGVNAALLVGHGQVRELVMGVEDREPTPEELEKMKALVREAMQGGAYGLSTGLGYIPGRYGKTDEVIALVREIVPHGGIYHSHIRNEGDTLIESIQEAIEIAEKTGAPTNVSHLKASSKPNWGKVKEACRLIEEARAKGLKVTADQYPYPISSGYPYRNLIPRTTWLGKEDTGELRDEMTRALDSLRDKMLLKLYQLQTPFMPVSEHHQEYLDALSRKELVRVVMEPLGRGMPRGAENLRERNAFLKRMDQPGEAQKIREEIENRINEWVGAENIIVDITVETELIGKSLKQVAEIKGMTVADAAIHLELQGAKVTPLQMALEDVEYIMKKDYVSLGSDGTAPFFGMGLVHPRSYGAFPEKIRKYAMERKVISLPHAIRSATSLPAQVMGWEDRGSIKEGYRADVVVFDPKTYGPRGNFTNAHRYAEGVEYLLVNGKLVIDKGEFNGNLAGQILLLKEPKYTSLK